MGSLYQDGRKQLRSLGVGQEVVGLGGEGESEESSWWDRLLGRSQEGRLTTTRGSGQMADGARVEWEVVEYNEDGDEGGKVTAKRKLENIDGEADEVMEGLH